MVVPVAWSRQKERYCGVLKVQLRRFSAAVRDFEHYVKFAPNSKDLPQVEEHLKELRRIREAIQAYESEACEQEDAP